MTGSCSHHAALRSAKSVSINQNISSLASSGAGRLACRWLNMAAKLAGHRGNPGLKRSSAGYTLSHGGCNGDFT